MGKSWTPQESDDALRLAWESFHERYPWRTYGSWAVQRHHLRRERGQPAYPAGARGAYTESFTERFTDVRLDDLDRLAREQRSEQRDRRPAEKAAVIPDIALNGEDGVDDDDLMDALIEWQRTRNNAFREPMEHAVSIELPDGDRRPIAIAFPSDWHIGNTGTDHERLIQDVNTIIAHPRVYCTLGGDPVDNFIIEKMIAASRTQIAQVDVQWRIFRNLVKRLTESDSLLFVGSGNHDAWTARVAGLDGLAQSLRDIPVIQTGEGGFVSVAVGRERYGVYRKHKPTRFTSGYNPTHFLKQMLRMGTPWDFDIGVSEHIHTPGFEVGEHRPGTGRMRVFITCGSYKIKDPWAEGLGYYGSTYGVPCVLLWPDHHEMLPVSSIEQAITVLDSY